MDTQWNCGATARTTTKDTHRGSFGTCVQWVASLSEADQVGASITIDGPFSFEITRYTIGSIKEFWRGADYPYR